MGLHHHHHHGHDHGASCGADDHGPAFAIGIGLNSALVLAQIAFGLLARSMALLADAGHNFGDVLSLALSWGAVWLASRPAPARFTYGLQSGSILAALANVVILLVAVGGIAWESALRVFHPAPVAGGMVMAVAVGGIFVNGVTAWLFARGRAHDINIRAAFLHMLGDTLISFGVVVAGLVVWQTGWLWVDPACSLIIAALIVWSSWGILKEATSMALQAAPQAIAPGRVRDFLRQRADVEDVHDLHIWAMSTTETALTAHLSMPAYPGADFLAETTAALRSEFGIGHATLQIEVGAGAEPCALAHHVAQ